MPTWKETKTMIVTHPESGDTATVVANISVSHWSGTYWQPPEDDFELLDYEVTYEDDFWTGWVTEEMVLEEIYKTGFGDNYEPHEKSED
jgi:hypothetical protein